MFGCKYERDLILESTHCLCSKVFRVHVIIYCKIKNCCYDSRGTLLT